MKTTLAVFFVLVLAIGLPTNKVKAKNSLEPVNTDRIDHKPSKIGDIDIEDFAVDDKGNLYILDLLQPGLIDKYGPSGDQEKFLNSSQSGGPIDFALSPDNLFLVSPLEVIMFPRSGESTQRWKPPKINGEKIQISSLHVDDKGGVYIGSIDNKETIYKTNTQGELLSKIPLPKVKQFKTESIYKGIIQFDKNNSL